MVMKKKAHSYLQSLVAVIVLKGGSCTLSDTGMNGCNGLERRQIENGYTTLVLWYNVIFYKCY